MSLLYGDNFKNQLVLPDKAFMYLFSGCTNMSTAENLILPATTMSASGYAYMFDTCTSLTTVPNLPATTLAPHCYRTTFARCTSLVAVPVDYLPVMELQEACYINMFLGCSNLRTVPDLPAKTLPSQCYQGLFSNCSKVNYIKCLATSKSSNSTSSWVGGVASSGTFVRDASMSWSTGNAGVPSGWTVVDYSPTA